MTGFEIAELFIRAAFIDTRLPDTARPKKLKAAWVPFVHTAEDIQSRIRTGDRHEKLEPGDNPFDEWLNEYWDEAKQKLTHADIADWERCNDLIKLVGNEDNRRALWNWAIAKAGGRPFVKWCRTEGIQEMTGSRRKDRAILAIEAQLVRNTLENNDNSPLGMLPTGPVLEHITDTLAADMPRKPKHACFADDAFQPFIVIPERGRTNELMVNDSAFDWAKARNERRRKRDAEKRKAA